MNTTQWFPHYRLIGSLFLSYVSQPPQILSKSKKAKMLGKCLITNITCHSTLKQWNDHNKFLGENDRRVGLLSKNMLYASFHPLSCNISVWNCFSFPAIHCYQGTHHMINRITKDKQRNRRNSNLLFAMEFNSVNRELKLGSKKKKTVDKIHSATIKCLWSVKKVVNYTTLQMMVHRRNYLSSVCVWKTR